MVSTTLKQGMLVRFRLVCLTGERNEQNKGDLGTNNVSDLGQVSR